MSCQRRSSGPGDRAGPVPAGARAGWVDASARRARRASRPTFATARGRQRGYTLIEVIVAFALLALALTLLLGTLSGAVRQVRWSGDAGVAALHAQSLLDTVGVGAPLEAGRDDGQFEGGRYRWSLAVTPWEEPLPPNIPRAPVQQNRLYEVALSVQWGSGSPRERLELRSLRLAPATAQAMLP